MARVRSPNYPALSLPEAIDRLRGLHKEQQTTAEPREVVILHMGYSGVNGRSLKALSALIKYGFLETTGDDRLRVSKRALSILFPDPDNPRAKNQALVDAAFAPVLFAKIFDRWKTKPTQASLHSFLAHEGFNTNSVDTVARAFYDTFDLVESLVASYGPNRTTAVDEQEEAEDEEEEGSMIEQGAVSTRPQTAANPTGSTPSVNSTKPVFDFESVLISTRIDNQEDLAELLNRLEQIKSMLPHKKSD